MNGLLPIIRRKRRPLIEVDDRPVIVGHVAAAQVAATKPVGEVATKTVTKASDAKPAGKLDP